MKKVLVTGSTQGIGKAIAKRFVENGYEVIVHGAKNLEKAERVKEEIAAAKAVVCDLSDMEQTIGLYEQTGAVDCLILNASVQYKEPWTQISDETLDEQLTVNIKSTLKLMQAYYPDMKAKGFGRIVTIGSVNQKNNHPELSLYGATKNAVLALVKNIAKQVAPYGVTVNNIAPGAIATPRNDSVYNDEILRKKVEEKIPLGRFGQAEEIAGTVLLLCGEDGNYITGADIFIDGGMGL